MDKIAIIEIDSLGKYNNVIEYCKENNIGYDIYNYPLNTTEWELDNELEHLIEFYCGAHIARPLPPHIRYEAIKRNEKIAAKLFIP